jgi:hypothetical protein
MNEPVFKDKDGEKNRIFVSRLVFTSVNETKQFVSKSASFYFVERTSFQRIKRSQAFTKSRQVFISMNEKVFNDKVEAKL